MQDRFCMLITDSFARGIYQKKSPTEFWCDVSEPYPQTFKLAFRILLPFATAYFCESGFLALLHMKTKERNRLKMKDDMRLALSPIQPRILRLAAEIQGQPSDRLQKVDCK